MGCVGFGLVLAGILLASTDLPRTDLEQLQGWWQYTSEVYDGDGIPSDVLKTYVMLVKDQVMKEVLEGGAIGSTSFRLNPEREPREIDQRPGHGDEEGKLQPGIYRVDGDRLTICFAFAGQPRPTEFTSKPGSRWVLVTFERKHLSRQDAERMARDFEEREERQRDAHTKAKLAKVRDARPRTTLAGHQSTVWDLAFSPDGKSLATSGDGGDTVRLWDVGTGRGRALLRPGLSEGYPVHIAFTPDGKTLATGGLDLKVYEKADDGQLPRTVLRLWDTHSGKDRLLVASKGDPPNIRSLAYSPDGKTLVVNNGHRLYLWDVMDETIRVRLEVPADTRISDFNTMTFTGAVISSDSRMFATSGLDHRVRLWDLASGRPLARFRGHGAAVHAVAFSKDGTRLASGGADKTVRIWPVTELHERKSSVQPERILQHNDGVNDLAFSADGTLLAAAGMNGVVTIYDARTWEFKTSFDTGQEICCKCAFSPDRSLLATCGSPSEIRIWDVARLLNATPP